MVLNFRDALEVKVADIDKPPLIPIGTYRAVVTKIPSIDEVGEGEDGWDTVDFQLRLLEPLGDDVDEADLQAYGGLTESSTIRYRFMFSRSDQHAQERSMYNVKRFCRDHLQIDGADKMNLKEMLNASVNHQCSVYVRWRPDKNDPEIQYNEVGKTGAL